MTSGMPIRHTKQREERQAVVASPNEPEVHGYAKGATEQNYQSRVSFHGRCLLILLNLPDRCGSRLGLLDQADL